MKYLTIIRHAKSSWSDPHLSDVDRPLNKRGLNSAPVMGQVLKNHGIQYIKTRPEDLSINTINKYLELKARGLI